MKRAPPPFVGLLLRPVVCAAALRSPGEGPGPEWLDLRGFAAESAEEARRASVSRAAK